MSIPRGATSEDGITERTAQLDRFPAPFPLVSNQVTPTGEEPPSVTARLATSEGLGLLWTAQVRARSVEPKGTNMWPSGSQCGGIRLERRGKLIQPDTQLC